MKYVLLMALTAMQVVAVSGAPVAAAKPGDAKTIPLAEARQKIDGVVGGSESIASLIKQLSAADQVTFLGEVNKAVAKMPASVEEKTAKHLNLNHAALKAAKGTGNVAALLAEVFATVPPEALTVINERFATDLFSRTADPRVQFTDERFVKIATNTVRIVQERCDETDNGSVRTAFAILMFVRASNGTPSDVMDQLIEMLKYDDAKDLARTEWFPAALGLDGRTKTYDPMLASANAGLRPDLDQVLVICGPQFEAALLADLSGKNTDTGNMVDTHTPVLDAVENVLVQQAPNFGNDKPGAAGAAGGAVNGAVIEGGGLPGGIIEGGTNTRPTPEDPDPQTPPSPPSPPSPDPGPIHPDPYRFQTMH